MKQGTIRILVSTCVFFNSITNLYAGSLCMNHLPERNDNQVSSPTMLQSEAYIPNRSRLKIQTKDKFMLVSTKNGGRIHGLENNKKHLIKILANGKVIQSFWLDFKKEGSSDLCLVYYQGYGSVSLHPSISKECNCIEDMQ